jgi:hypothetical protein
MFCLRLSCRLIVPAEARPVDEFAGATAVAAATAAKRAHASGHVGRGAMMTSFPRTGARSRVKSRPLADGHTWCGRVANRAPPGRLLQRAGRRVLLARRSAVQSSQRVSDSLTLYGRQVASVQVQVGSGQVSRSAAPDRKQAAMYVCTMRSRCSPRSGPSRPPHGSGRPRPDNRRPGPIWQHAARGAWFATEAPMMPRAPLPNPTSTCLHRPIFAMLRFANCCAARSKAHPKPCVAVMQRCTASPPSPSNANVAPGHPISHAVQCFSASFPRYPSLRSSSLAYNALIPHRLPLSRHRGSAHYPTPTASRTTRDSQTGLRLGCTRRRDIDAPTRVAWIVSKGLSLFDTVIHCAPVFAIRARALFDDKAIRRVACRSG